MCTTYVACHPRFQKRAMDLLELELQMVASHQAAVEKGNLGCLQEQQVLLTAGLTLQAIFHLRLQTVGYANLYSLNKPKTCCAKGES